MRHQRNAFRQEEASWLGAPVAFSPAHQSSCCCRALRRAPVQGLHGHTLTLVISMQSEEARVNTLFKFGVQCSTEPGATHACTIASGTAHNSSSAQLLKWHKISLTQTSRKHRTWVSNGQCLLCGNSPLPDSVAYHIPAELQATAATLQPHSFNTLPYSSTSLKSKAMYNCICTMDILLHKTKQRI